MSDRLWFERAWTGSAVEDGVLVTVAADGTVTSLESGVAEAPADARPFAGLALPGAVNAHSHAFHRLLRGRTHGDGGTFWTWREVMYRAAGQLTPENYERLATAVFAEMLTAGYTAVGEFHYVHHRPGGEAYGTDGAVGTEGAAGACAMERALARAAESVEIRLVLLDTAYLAGGLVDSAHGTPLGPEQQRFTDGDIEAYLARHDRLAEVLEREHGASGLVTLGAAIHSVRAVPEDAIARFAALDGPVHVHLSEQPAENADCLAVHGLTPTGLLARAGVLTDRLSAVHATHLTGEDIALLGEAGASVVMCPTTEADLADGIGPARALADAGVTIALGSDQHVVLDPLLEVRGLEAGERLGSGERGRFAPAELVEALTAGGARSLGLRTGLQVGAPADAVVLRTDSVRTIGSVDEQTVLAATGQDVTAVLVNGQVRAENGVHARLGDVAALYRDALAEFSLDA